MPAHGEPKASQVEPLHLSRCKPCTFSLAARIVWYIPEVELIWPELLLHCEPSGFMICPYVAARRKSNPGSARSRSAPCSSPGTRIEDGAARSRDRFKRNPRAGYAHGVCCSKPATTRISLSLGIELSLAIRTDAFSQASLYASASIKQYISPTPAAIMPLVGLRAKR